MTNTKKFGCAGTLCSEPKLLCNLKCIEILKIGDFVNKKLLWFETLTYFLLLLYIWQNSSACF